MSLGIYGCGRQASVPSWARNLPTGSPPLEHDTITFHVPIDEDLIDALTVLAIQYPALSFNQLAREALISVADAAGEVPLH